MSFDSPARGSSAPWTLLVHGGAGSMTRQRRALYWPKLTAMCGMGGVIVTAPRGETAIHFNMPGLYRGKATSDKEHGVAIYGNE